MSLVNFHFTKVEAERHNAEVKSYKIKQDLTISSVDITKVGKSTNEIIIVGFRIAVNYIPDFATLVLEGKATFVESPEGLKAIKDSYTKTKKLPGKWGIQVMNVILLRSTVRLLALAQDINVPPHIQLPMYSPKTKKANDYIG